MTRILIIEDHPLVSEATTELLQAYNARCEIAVAETADDALDMLTTSEWDLILLDLDVPGAQGLSLARELAARSYASRACIVTALCKPAFVEDARALGFRGFIPKSLPLNVFGEALREVLSGAESFPTATPPEKSSAPSAQRLRSDAQTELEARSDYFSAANHDLHQRLHALKLLTETTASTARVPGVVSRAAQRLEEAVRQLDAYVTNVLEFARFEHVAHQPSLSLVDLQEVFQQLNVEFEEIAETNRVELRFRTTSIGLVSDRMMLVRILQNIVSNALKFTREKGKVLVVARTRASSISIEVWDQGRGIPEDACKSIFRSFYQVPYYSRRREGVGLGLSIVERLARSLGYEVVVRSTEGRGTVMKVVIPVEATQYDEAPLR